MDEKKAGILAAGPKTINACRPPQAKQQTGIGAAVTRRMGGGSGQFEAIRL